LSQCYYVYNNIWFVLDVFSNNIVQSPFANFVYLKSGKSLKLRNARCHQKLLTRTLWWHLQLEYSRQSSCRRHNGGILDFWCRYAQSVCLLFGRRAPSLALISPATLYSINSELGFLHSVLGSDGVPDKRAVKTASRMIIPIPPLPERVLAVPFLMRFPFGCGIN